MAVTFQVTRQRKIEQWETATFTVTASDEEEAERLAEDTPDSTLDFNNTVRSFNNTVRLFEVVGRTADVIRRVKT